LATLSGDNTGRSRCSFLGLYTTAVDEAFALDSRKWAIRGNDGHCLHQLVRVLSVDLLGTSALKSLSCAFDGT
jgi:hypothetical protein